MSARSKKPTQKPPPIPPEAKPSLDEQKTGIFDSGNFAKPASQPASQPFKTISMKTPSAEDVGLAKKPERPVHQVRLRAISEVTPLPHAQPKNLGFLAPPRDASEVRARHWRDYVIWGCVAIMLASAIALGIWFLGK